MNDVLDLKQFDNATPGPWAWSSTGEQDNSWGVGVVYDKDDVQLSGEIKLTDDHVIDGIAVSALDMGNKIDARLIAAAPQLLEEVRRLRAKVAALESCITGVTND